MAKSEQRTKSELFREMVRVYRRYTAVRDREEERLVATIIEQARAEQAAGAMTVEQMLAEDARLLHYGAARATRVGIKPSDVNRVIHEERERKRPHRPSTNGQRQSRKA